MLHQKIIAVVVPAFNEERFIEATLESVPRYVDQVIVVDDGSEDNTAVRVQNRCDGRVILLRHEKNRGVGAALATGYREAFKEGADIVAVMAGDGQMDPNDLHALIQPILIGRADYVKGNRLSHPEIRRRMPKSRWIGNLLFTLLTRWAVGVPVSDSQCGYTALSRHAARKLPFERLWKGYGYPNDLLGWLSQAGARIYEVQVKPIYGQEISGIGLRHALWVIPGVLLRTWFRRIRAARGLSRSTAETTALQLSRTGQNAM